MQPIQPADLPIPPVPLSPGVRAGDFVFVSGQVANDVSGTVLLGDFAAEVHATLDNVEKVLAAAGATMRQVVKVNAYLANSTLFAPFNQIYAERMQQPFPARTTVVLSFGHPDVRVEIEAVAYLGS